MYNKSFHAISNYTDKYHHWYTLQNTVSTTRWFSRPQMVTHPSTNQAQCWLTTFLAANAMHPSSNRLSPLLGIYRSSKYRSQCANHYTTPPLVCVDRHIKDCEYKNSIMQTRHSSQGHITDKILTVLVLRMHNGIHGFNSQSFTTILLIFDLG